MNEKLLDFPDPAVPKVKPLVADGVFWSDAPAALNEKPVLPVCPASAALNVKLLLTIGADCLLWSDLELVSSHPGRIVSHAAHLVSPSLFWTIHDSHFQELVSVTNMLPQPAVV